MRAHLRYYYTSFMVTLVGLGLSSWIGYYYTGTVDGALRMTFICLVLSVLEISLSFDNAIVNAKVLKDMTDLWRRRFLTWGMLIAVFGMRLVFPLLIVGIVAQLGPWEALVLAATQPAQYAEIMQSVHIQIAAFGGSFLLLVALKYFFDANKDVHWLQSIEAPLTKLGRMNAIEIGISLLCLYAVSRFHPVAESRDFLISGLFGIVTFIIVDGISAFLEAPDTAVGDLHKASAAAFLYLEVLDASFSFDGVVGAFAITQNLFIITIGLGVGAMYVRSMTIMLVERGTLSHFVYLEHGAFYAIGALAVTMFVGTFRHVSESMTGLIGAVFISLSFWSSIRYKKKHLRS